MKNALKRRGLFYPQLAYVLHLGRKFHALMGKFAAHEMQTKQLHIGLLNFIHGLETT
jgi:hypothetical protein